MHTKRLVAPLVLAAGIVGLIACAAGACSVWLLERRLTRASEKAFTIVDKGLNDALGRLKSGQERIRASKTRTDEIAGKIRAWSSSNTKERLLSALDIERRAEKLSESLQTADQVVDSSLQSIRGIENLLEVAASVGLPVEPRSLQLVAEELSSMRDTLQGTQRAVDGIREFATNRPGESEEKLVSRIVKVLGRTDAAAAAIDARLADVAVRVSRIQSDTQQLQARLGNYLFVTAIAGYVVLAWIGAGQAALCLLSWNNGRKADVSLPTARRVNEY